MAGLFTMNMQVLGGIKIQTWAFEGHGVTMLATIAIAIFSYSTIKQNYLSNIYQILLLMVLLYINLIYNDFHFDSLQWRIYQGGNFTKDNIEKIKQHPLEALIAHNYVASSFSYAFPKLPHLIFSYQYDFPFVTGTCNSLHALHETALPYALKSVPKENFAYNEFILLLDTKISNLETSIQ